MGTERIDPERETSMRALVLGHLPALLAGGAVGLYVLGIVATVGRLRASDLDVSQAMGRIPLEVHLRNGIAAIADPVTLVVLGMYAALVIATLGVVNLPVVRHASKAEEPEPPEAETASEPAETEAASESRETDAAEAESPDSDSSEGWWRRQVTRVGAGFRWLLARPTGGFRHLGSRLYVTSLVVLVVALALTLPWPFAGFIVLTVVGLLLPYALLDDRRQVVKAYLFSMLATGVLIAALDAYYRSDPLPTGRVVTLTGVIRAPIIAADGGLLYLGPSDKRGIYSAIPTTKVVSLTATPRERPEESSVLNWLGLGWR